MSLTKITNEGVYYLEGVEVPGDIPAPVLGDLAVYAYAPVGGFKGQTFSYGDGGWFERGQVGQADNGDTATSVVLPDLLSGEDNINNVLVVEHGQFQYQAISSGSADQVLGTIGAPGDLVHIINYYFASISTLTIKDGATTIYQVTGDDYFHYDGTASLAKSSGYNGTIILDAVCLTNWNITTGGGVSALCTGRFT